MPAAAIPWIIAGTSAVGAGAAVASARSAGSAAKTQKQIAEENFARARPAFDTAFGHYNNILTGGPAALSKALGPEINANNMAFQNARQNLMSNPMLGRGGGLTSRFAQLEGQRAMNISNLIGNARSNAASNLANLATGNQSTGLEALAGARASQAASAQQSSQAWGQVGSFITRLLSDPSFLSRNNAQANPYAGLSSLNSAGGLPGYIPPAISSSVVGPITRTSGYVAPPAPQTF